MPYSTAVVALHNESSQPITLIGWEVDHVDGLALLGLKLIPFPEGFTPFTPLEGFPPAQNMATVPITYVEFNPHPQIEPAAKDFNGTNYHNHMWIMYGIELIAGRAEGILSGSRILYTSAGSTYAVDIPLEVRLCDGTNKCSLDSSKEQ